MDSGLPGALLATVDLPLLLAAGALLLALMALWQAGRSRQSQQNELAVLRERSETLWREVDDLRVSQFNHSDATPSQATGSLDQSRYQTEMEAYNHIWPQIWHLHERLGMFLRTVEAGDAAGELRLEARNAALEARNLLNRHRPFCNELVDELLTRFIDVEIKAHLAACQYLDLLKDAATAPSNHDRRVLHEKYHGLHEGEARELMNQLVTSIRHRAIKP
ncbi:hypothetical protein C7H09_12225 [Marinobacter fuscus]|uniref:Uncharacterized protein n=1 Tax=Marinobacter fuscus TaxID=2109942 RepID=A0A2T1K7M0_9GAMM|nr:hypothetical protein [Marinobacter fuscus]PSF06097.1 hypothetical protein C7H09_12225 [Marinobacter fuscus]